MVDFVGYGNANASEGGPAPALTNTTAAIRQAGGCADTNNNRADFSVGSPAPGAPGVVRGDVFERLRLLSPDVIFRHGSGRARSLWGAVHQHDDAVRIRKRQRFQDHGVDNGKYGRVGSDSERQRRDRGSKAGILGETCERSV